MKDRTKLRFDLCGTVGDSRMASRTRELVGFWARWRSDSVGREVMLEAEADVSMVDGLRIGGQRDLPIEYDLVMGLV